MVKYILAGLLLLPLFVCAQNVVTPIISNDYQELIRTDTAQLNRIINDSTRTGLRYNGNGSSYPAQEIIIKNNSLTLRASQMLAITGGFTSGAAIRQRNSIPSLQTVFAAGRSISGAPTWQGAETGEIFSYGPALATLEYDGSSYLYDQRGRLVSSGSGTGIPAEAANNSIFRTGFLQSHFLSAQATMERNYPNQLLLDFKASLTDEKLMIRENSNVTDNFSITLEQLSKKFKYTASYQRGGTKLANSNRGGYLNRIYQNSLLAPATFDNMQGSLLSGGVQRSYSASADNPEFLLTNNGHTSRSSQQTGSLSAQKKEGRFKFGSIVSWNEVSRRANESLLPGTAFFAPGFPLDYQKTDAHYRASNFTEYFIRYGRGPFKSTAKMNYVYSNDKTGTTYQPANTNYRFHRSLHEISVGYDSQYERSGQTLILNAANKIYLSSTQAKPQYFLPEVSGSVNIHSVFNSDMDAKFVATMNSFVTEPQISNSYAGYGLTKLNPVNAFQFMPIEEAQGFNNLQPMRNREYNARMELRLNHRYSLEGNYFSRSTNDNVFPIYQANKLVLQNLADTRTNGFEANLTASFYGGRDLRDVRTILSFYTWNSRVTDVLPGFNNTAISGFSTVYKGIVKGQPLGVILGNTYLRDQQGRMVIGNDGFPLQQGQPSVIGNPTPDFLIKFSHTMTFKNITLNIDGDYKKGGDIWNGTQAVLDYQGRSSTSSDLRGTTGYVFNGVTATGQNNTIPVKFYDTSLPINQSRFVRYGYTGVAEEYIEKANAIRLRNIAVSYKIPFKKGPQYLRFMAYAENILLWCSYSGADPETLLFDQPDSSGLDFFNLPSVRSIGVNVSIQF